MAKPLASLSLDLDNKWSYMKTHGDSGWESFPTYLDVAVPRILRFLADRELRITFFIVGKDASLAENADAIASIARAGHEIGNHTFNHDPWLHLYSVVELEDELERAEAAIEGVTGKRPIGFRGPGFSLSTAVLRALWRRGYRYDASTLPNSLNSLARTYFLMSSNLTGAERKRRGALFGGFSDALRPLRPFKWSLEEGELLELPVTTMPLFRVPIHFSYVLFLGGFSRRLALTYFRCALRLCAMTGTEPSLLMHPLDFLGCDDVQELSFFPAMKLKSDVKVDIMAQAIDSLTRRFTVLAMDDHVERISRREDLKAVVPKFKRERAAATGCSREATKELPRA